MLRIPNQIADEFEDVSTTFGKNRVIRGDAVLDFIDACRRDGIAVSAGEGFLRVKEGFVAQMELIADFVPDEAELAQAEDWSEIVALYARRAKAELSRRLKMYDDIESLYFEFYFKTQEEAEAED